MAKSSKWQTYEQVSAYLLNNFREEFGLAKVEGKQKLIGLETRTEWEVDAKGILNNKVCSPEAHSPDHATKLALYLAVDLSVSQAVSCLPSRWAANSFNEEKYEFHAIALVRSGSRISFCYRWNIASEQVKSPLVTALDQSYILVLASI